jgi:hypothetical protein
MGRIKAVMTSDLNNPASVANILKDRRYREIAGDLQMFKTGLDTLKKSATVDKLVDRYVSAQYELTISKDAPALREARYFAKNIGKAQKEFKDGLSEGQKAAAGETPAEAPKADGQA